MNLYGARMSSLNPFAIFDRGYSGFNGRINEKSSGLGLYLVKTIANVINVKVNAQSTLNVGSVFSIRFPSN